MGKNCVCDKGNWESLSCPEHGLETQSMRRRKTYHAFNMRENITKWDEVTRTSKITYTIVYGFDPEDAIESLEERFPHDQWLLVETNDDVQWCYGVKKVVISQNGIEYFPPRNEEQMKLYEEIKKNGGIER